MIRSKSTIPVSKEQSRNRAPAGLRARGRRGEALSSARDRQRLRERSRAERERVEEIIAGAAISVERRVQLRESVVPQYTAHPRPVELRMSESTGCPVCGDGRTVSDEVMHGGTLRVSECLHCEHRWTQRPKGRWVELGARMSRAGRPRALAAVQAHPRRWS